MLEIVGDSKSPAARRAGSIPASGTTRYYATKSIVVFAVAWCPVSNRLQHRAMIPVFRPRILAGRDPHPH